MKRIDPLSSEARAGRRLLILLALAALAGLMLGVSLGRAQAASADFVLPMTPMAELDDHAHSNTTPTDAATRRKHLP